ncbi:MAG: dehydrogenase [Thermomicrobiales bacterium]|nr:dehydrogenase [Thermomicrobiales bacterium]
MAEPFRIGFTSDFFLPDGSSAFGDIGTGLLESVPNVAWEQIGERGPELQPEEIAPFDAIAVLSRRVPARTLDGAPKLTIVARYGVGYDSVDVPACTRNGVLLTITPEGVRRPMATVNLTYLLALSHRLLEQDRFIRAGGWATKHEVRGVGLAGHTLGLVGFGNIAREFVTLARPLEMTVRAHDPFADPAAAAALGVELVDLDTLFETADFLAVLCALTPETRHLVSAERLAQMKPTAYLINAARGPIVDQAALTQALQKGRLAGAALDVFEREPIDPGDPLLSLPNVLLSPHGLGLTDEWSYITGQVACAAMLDVAGGRVPPNVVNRDVLDSPILREKLRRYEEACR